MKIDRIDHIVLTVADIQRTVAFYTRVLSMKKVVFEGGWTALHFGGQKINLHPAGKEAKPNARNADVGTGDLCFVADQPIGEIVRELQAHDVELELGPVPQVGALGGMQSVYFRDPDDNLIEVATYRT